LAATKLNQPRFWKRWAFLDDGVMIGPCGLEPVGELLDGAGAVRSPYDEADSGSAETGEHPEKTFHSTSIAA
jgi:hypothetical protein